MQRLRNIGIIAHVNAGKTTTTERILYHAGSTDVVGDVDRGNTVTDYLAQERDRGITITAAAVTFKWQKHQINLIDTPGHVDFTVEVERSLSVMDGAVTILDASAGVEAQTVTVWNQAAKYKLPNLILLNKYDKPQADYSMCMKQLNKSLDARAQLVQLPVKSSKSNRFSQILDVIDRKLIEWKRPESNHGSEFSVQDLEACPSLSKLHVDTLEQERERLINILSDVEDDFACHVLESNKMSAVSGEAIKQALRNATLKCQICPVLVGSSFKYIGVQQLMSSIVDYLPSPPERARQIQGAFSLNLNHNRTPVEPKSCAFIFKIAQDSRLGSLAYMRVYGGEVKKGEKLVNLDTGKQEHVRKIYRVFADEFRELDTPVGCGDIVVASGVTEARTGDILVDVNFLKQREIRESEITSSKVPFRLLEAGQGSIAVPQIATLDPVYYCSIESRLGSQQLKLEQSLASMAREDPSLTYELDEHGITTIRGMGKLHLEVARDRLESERGIDAILGPLQISFRETIEGSATEELTADRAIGSTKSSVSLKLSVRCKPGAGAWLDKKLRLDLSGESELGKLRNDHRKAIGYGIESALKHGPVRGYPIIDCDVCLIEFRANNRCALPMISSTVARCLTAAVRRCSPVLLEPIMLLEVVAPQECNGLILGDIASRRGVVESTSARTNGSIVVRGQVPLANLSNYSEFLRISTSGQASFSMELHSYSPLSERDWSKMGQV